MLKTWAWHINASVVCFGLIAVVVFWCAIQLAWSVRGKRWYSVVARLVGVTLLCAFGVVMVFFTAFGSDGN